MKVEKSQLSWKNPKAEFSHVRVYIDGEVNPIKENIKNEKLDLENVDQETTYKITTVDNSGKESLGDKDNCSKSNVIVNKMEVMII